jgi:hypothetical protein
VWLRRFRTLQKPNKPNSKQMRLPTLLQVAGLSFTVRERAGVHHRLLSDVGCPSSCPL